MSNIHRPSNTKRFLEDVLLLHSMSKNLSLLVTEMLHYVNQEGYFIINAFVKHDLANKVSSSTGSVENAISRMTEAGILHRIDRGVYIFCNPVSQLLREPGDQLDIRIRYEGSERTFY